MERGPIQTLAELLHLTNKHKCRLVKMMFDESTSPQLLEFTIRKIHRMAPQMLCALNKPDEERRGIYILLCYTRDEDVSQQLKMLEQIPDISAKCQLNVSKPFADLADIPSAKVQTDFLGEYFAAPYYKEGIHRYEYYSMNHILKTITDHIPSDCYTPMEIQRLENYDRENHTNYLETLYVYLHNFRNNRKTIEYFGVHRNTLLHRLGQIQTITGIQLDDEQELLRLLITLELLQAKGNRAETKEKDKK